MLAQMPLKALGQHPGGQTIRVDTQRSVSQYV